MTDSKEIMHAWDKKYGYFCSDPANKPARKRYFAFQAYLKVKEMIQSNQPMDLQLFEESMHLVCESEFLDELLKGFK